MRHLTFSEKASCQWQDVLSSLSQGWQIQTEGAQPVEEVFAKPPCCDILLQIAIGGGNETHVHFDFGHAAQARNRF